MVDAGGRRRGGRTAFAIAMGVVAVLGAAAVLGVRFLTQTGPGTSVDEPPVSAGQQLWGTCAGGFYARPGEQIVDVERALRHRGDGGAQRRRRGSRRFGPSLGTRGPVEGHRCAPSDMNYLVVAGDQVPRVA